MTPKNKWKKVSYWTAQGYTEAEAQVMVEGRTIAQARATLGGIWQVGNVQFPQALSKTHAEKLYRSNFGGTDEARFVEVTK